MARFVLNRLVALAGILLALSAIVFALEAVIPADPVKAMVGASATPEAVAAKRAELGLDEPLPVQYVRFLRRAVTGDLSLSLHSRRPVVTDLGDYLPATIELAGAAALLALVLGAALGLGATRRGGQWLRVVLLGGASAPTFLLGLILLLVFYSRLRWLPGSGRLSGTIDAPVGPTGLLTVDGLLHGRLDVVR
ncbi:MAG: ABC transporter permease, partial [Acidimicrobiales bacterium]